MVRDPQLVAWLRWYVEKCSPEIKLWPGKQARFSKFFGNVRDRLGWARLPLTPGCLRPGGATEAFLEGDSISSLKYRGRWRVESSLEVYIQEAMSHLCICELNDAEFVALTSLVAAGAAQWSDPPALPWEHYFSRAAQCRGLENYHLGLARAQMQASSTPKPQRAC